MLVPDSFVLDLSERVVAVTGAASGIGEATALACARAGAAVSLADLRRGRLGPLAERIESEGGRAIAIPTDVGDEGQARAFIEGTRERFGRVDVLVNNAGVMRLGPIEGAPMQEWRESVEVNILGVLYCTHAVLPVMRAQGSGDIVNVNSMSGRRARAGTGVYRLTKFGVLGFSESLRQEVGEHGIRVILIEPGLGSDAGDDERAARRPLCRGGGSCGRRRRPGDRLRVGAAA
jgi:clavulanate-9-aldehyde reducatase